MTIDRLRRWRVPGPAALLVLACGGLPALVPAGPGAVAQTAAGVPQVEIVEEDVGMFATLAEYIIDFQRRANAEIATHMTAIERGDDLGAFFLGLAIAFVYGVAHAFGPGHGKFVIVSYFLGREVRVARGVVMALQVAIVHVIAAVIIVWLADAVLRAGFGIGLSEVPGVRAASFLIIVGIGVYMLFQAVRMSTSAAPRDGAGHGHMVTGTVTGTATATNTATATATATGTATTTGTATGTAWKAACWPWRPVWCRVRGRS